MPIKFSPKRHVFDKEKQPERLKIHFIAQLKEMFNIQFIPFGNIHKEALCEISKSLYRQIYEKMVCSKPQNLDSYVEEISDILLGAKEGAMLEGVLLLYGDDESLGII